jgi:kynureninase
VVDGLPQSRERAVEADRLDPLAPYRDEFVISPEGPIYLDGNSLGRQPRGTAAAVAAVTREWSRDLVGGWERWIDLPGAVGDRIGQLIGAAPGQVVVSDSTTVNLYKLVVAAMDASPDRKVIVGDKHDFPTVRYVLQGVAARAGGHVRLLETDPVDGLDPADALDGIDEEVALVCLSAANYRSGAVVDLPAVTSAAHRAGALTLWDLSHAAGVVPLDLDGAGADLAVGCTYKYLNGGPGAPAWLYVRAGLQGTLRQPVWGWWGQRDQFSMGADYDPAEGIDRFLAGTPAVLGIASVDAGIAPLLAAGIPAIWAKARRLVSRLAQRAEELFLPLGARFASPSVTDRRGGHLAISHPGSLAAARLLIERGLVVPDFRPPDVLRLAPVALYTSFAEVWDAAELIATVLADPAVRAPVLRKRVTWESPWRIGSPECW